PDSNGDGKIDVNDFNFQGIQSLLDRIAVAVGLPPHSLTATYNIATGDLKFNFTLDPWFGLGTNVQVITGPKAVVTTGLNGSGTQNEKQELVVNATGGVFKLSFKGKSTGFLPSGATAAQVRDALGGLSTIGTGSSGCGVLPTP